MTRTRFAIGSVLLWSAVTAGSGNAQAPLKHAPPMAIACCAVAAVDARTGVVTAKVLATGATFQFMFGWYDPKLGIGPVDGLGPVDALKGAATLHVGQQLWANAKGRVSVNGIAACCGVVKKLRSGPAIKEGPPQIEYDAHVPGCDAVAASTFPQGGHSCKPLATMTKSGTNPDGSDATWSWTCICS